VIAGLGTGGYALALRAMAAILEAAADEAEDDTQDEDA
jgi:hypothetical protein